MSQNLTHAHETSVFTGAIVTVKVGRSKRDVHVHNELLRSRSPYFDQVLARPKHNEDKTAIIVVSDVDVDTFCRFLSWLYADCFIVPTDDEWMGSCKLWLLAERFQVSSRNLFIDLADDIHQIPPLQNKVVEVFSCRLYQRQHTTLDLEILHYVYDNTGPGSQLRKLFVHISMWYGSQDVFAQMLKDMPPVFQFDFAAQQAKRAQKFAEEERIDPWDLTEYLLPEIVVGAGRKAVGVKVKAEDMGVSGVKRDILEQEKRNRRKRVKVETL
ncbi:hypothetical protein FB567DRAFT_212017 [Paraphoma chrysanthemicola]|uniref:BTB domain-containing protein n=1 Tax=Paraphoma chrysanthemicola TaxID=798071 RepID=A0A8K0VSK7_9PLEO|nr:hypothetical protein FB567DRAFT_212017 [Paraphoma chrysanthemicola]